MFGKPRANKIARTRSALNFPVRLPIVFVTRRIPGDALSRLKEEYLVKVYPKNTIIPRSALLKGVKDCAALLCLLTDKIDKEIIDAAPQLKVISNYAVGYNNIDVDYATQKGIVVCNTPSLQVVDAVAEHTFALLLAIAKRFHEDEQFVREHKWKSWAPQLLLGTQIKGKTLGVVGLGKIGKGVSERAICLGMHVLYNDVYRDRKFEKKTGAIKVPLRKLLQSSDFVTLHVNLTKKTHHLIGAKELALLKKTAYLINTSRGPIVDEDALTKVLKKKQIAGAGLDVYEQEPDQNHPLHHLKNCILTPHTASATIEVRLQMGKDVVDNIIAVLSGRKPEKIVNSQVWSKRRK